MNKPASSATDADALLAVPTTRRDRSAAGDYRAPAVADLVAAELRRRILDGELADGDELSRQEDLLVEFGVSKPSMREALRILESEGLLSVRRGKVGGAVVHRPGADSVAYALGTVLRSVGAPVEDLSMALGLLEPQCVALCAGRADRDVEVVPHLRVLVDGAAACIDDDLRRFATLSRQFHEEIVRRCGSPTLTLLIGALESVWTAHAEAWADIHLSEHDFPDLEYRQQGLEHHRAILRAIEAGDVDGAVAESHRHLAWSPVYDIADDHRVLPNLMATRSHL